jgi:predicted O-methyltransferase YrrM
LLHVSPSRRHAARFLMSLRALSPRVAWFLWQARRHAVRSGDHFSLASAVRPAQLAALLALARRGRRVVELGTGTCWSAVALALDNSERRVVSYDPVVRPEREAYLAMVNPAVRGRIELREEPDTAGPRPAESADLLFIDSAHDRQSVLAAFRAWQSALAPGAVVAFHDYGHAEYPGVREAVLELGLSGEESEGMFVWRAHGSGA